jgi:hypothetical protein
MLNRPIRLSAIRSHVTIQVNSEDFMKRFTTPAILGAALVAASGLTYGQALTEYGGMAARSANSAASAGAAGKNAGKLLGGLGKTLDQAGKQGGPVEAVPGSTAAAKRSPATTASAAQTASAVVPPAVPVSKAPEPPSPPADLSLIQEGMERKELVEKIGKPSMSISGMESSVLVETAWYKNGAATVVVTLRDNKVTGIAR